MSEIFGETSEIFENILESILKRSNDFTQYSERDQESTENYSKKEKEERKDAATSSFTSSVDTWQFYFPAYEILLDELRDYRFFASDMLHPSEQAVDYIWEKFRETVFSSELNDCASHLYSIRQALAHRPLHPESDDYRKFYTKLSSVSQSSLINLDLLRNKRRSVYKTHIKEEEILHFSTESVVFPLFCHPQLSTNPLPTLGVPQIQIEKKCRNNTRKTNITHLTKQQ